MTQNYKFHKTSQFRQVCKAFKDHASYHKIPAPVVEYTGTTKLHGTNGSIVIHEDGVVSFHSKKNLLGKIEKGVFTLDSDNSNFAGYMSTKDSLKVIVERAKQVVKEFHGKEIYPIKISGEWCGCFHANTPILLSDGSTEKIGVIVNKRLPVEVLSFNKEKGKLESKKVVDWFKNGETEEWLTITAKKRKRGGKGHRIVVTPNHKVFSKSNGEIIEISAGDLKEGDTVFVSGKRLSHKASQFIMGSMLGDGSFGGKRHYVTSHSLDNQPEYMRFIENLLDGSVKKATSGYGSNMESFYSKSYPEIEDMWDELYQSGSSKEPTEKYLNRLGVIGLAAWFMDDGSLINTGNGRQPQCELHTLGFSKETNKNIAKWFRSRGYECYTVDINNEKYSRPMSNVRFTVEGASAFLEDIAPYILTNFDYKLPENLQKIPKICILKTYSEYENPLVETTVTSIIEGNPYSKPSDKVRYDICVEGNSNYFANQILVHNSGIQKGVGINKLTGKAFFIFGIKAGQATQDEDSLGWLPLKEQLKLVSQETYHEGVYSVMSFETQTLKIDFGNPSMSTNILSDYTKQVEKECPVSKQLGLEGEIIGEGLVWTPTNSVFSCNSGYFFKTKGEKHSVSKVKTLVEVDPIKLESINSFIEYAVTENRLNQGVEETGELSQKKIGKFISWVSKDIHEEEQDVLKENNLIMKDVGSAVANKSRTFYLDKLQNEYLTEIKEELQ